MSRHLRASIALTLLLPALGGCGAGPSKESNVEAARGDRASAVAALRSADSALQAAVEAKDPGRTADLYMADATLLPIAEPAVAGREAIRREWEKTFGIPGFENGARTTRVVVSASGDLGFTQGTYESAMTGADGRPTVERGKWLSVWRRDWDGRWRVAVDIANTDAPPPEHQESTVHDRAPRPGG